MGNVFSQCLMLLSNQNDYDSIPIPKAVREVFDKYATESGVITSKALLKFFQESQMDKGVLRGPIANILLSFPSSIGPTRADGTPTNGVGDRPVACSDPPSRTYRSMSYPKGPGGGGGGSNVFSRTMQKISLTVGSRNVTSTEPNINEFFRLLLNPVATSPIDVKVTQDMKRPLAEYYIYTGHNSYLKGNQLTSDSSVKPIIKSLTRGVRVIELDLWPNRENTEILVMHGGTLTKPVGFEDCIRAIKEHAFVASEYPVIITLEDHLPANLQAKAAQVMTSVLGDSLYYPREQEQEMTQFPSPYSLRKKIIISTQPPKPPAELNTILATDEAAQKLFDGLGEDRGDNGGDRGSSRHGEKDRVRETGEGGAEPSNNAVVEGGTAVAKPSSPHEGRGGGAEGGGAGGPLPAESRGDDNSTGRSGSERLSSNGSGSSSIGGRTGSGKHSTGGFFTEGKKDKKGEGEQRSRREGEGAAAEPAREGTQGEGVVEARQGNGEAGVQRVVQTKTLRHILSLSGRGGEASDGRGRCPTEVVEEPLQEKAPEYRRLITIPGGRLKGATLSTALQDQEAVKRISLSETQLASAAKTIPQELVRFTQRNLLRIYPFGLRVLSSNYNPMPAWLHGAQMVALNMQGYGRPLWLTHGFFKANGGCGYVRKPLFYMHRKGGLNWPVLSSPDSADAANPSTPSSSTPSLQIFNPHELRPVQLHLRVRVLLGTGWREHYDDMHFDITSLPDFYCKVSIDGVPADIVEKRLEVRADEWHPTWEDTTLEFPLILPELALLSFEVMERDRLQDDFAGQVVLPVAALRPGFRCVSLYDKKGKPLVVTDGANSRGPRLLCHFELIKTAAASADASAANAAAPAGPDGSSSGHVQGQSKGPAQEWFSRESSASASASASGPTLFAGLDLGVSRLTEQAMSKAAEAPL